MSFHSSEWVIEQSDAYVCCLHGVIQDATDAGSQGARGALDEYNSVYDAETEPSEENEAATLLPMPDTIGQQTQRPQQAASLMDAEATTSRVFTPAERGMILSADARPKIIASLVATW